MPGRCTICYSPSRASIEADLLNEVPYREIARRYGVGRGAVSNHHKNHMEGPPGKYGPYQPPTEPAPSFGGCEGRTGGRPDSPGRPGWAS